LNSVQRYKEIRRCKLRIILWKGASLSDGDVDHDVNMGKLLDSVFN